MEEGREEKFLVFLGFICFLFICLTGIFFFIRSVFEGWVSLCFYFIDVEVKI